MPTLNLILAKLARAQTSFFRAADSVPAEQWKAKPGAEEWSAAELVAHLIMVERAIVGGADRITQKSPKPIPYFKRFHWPLWLVESRLIRRNHHFRWIATSSGKKKGCSQNCEQRGNAHSHSLMKRANAT